MSVSSPSCLHTTVASSTLQSLSSQTVPHLPLNATSTTPDLSAPPTRRTEKSSEPSSRQMNTISHNAFILQHILLVIKHSTPPATLHPVTLALSQSLRWTSLESHDTSISDSNALTTLLSLYRRKGKECDDTIRKYISVVPFNVCCSSFIS